MENIMSKNVLIQSLLVVLKQVKEKVEKEQDEENWLLPILRYYWENSPENTMSKGPRLRYLHIEFNPLDVWINKMGLNK